MVKLDAQKINNLILKIRNNNNNLYTKPWKQDNPEVHKQASNNKKNLIHLLKNLNYMFRKILQEVTRNSILKLSKTCLIQNKKARTITILILKNIQQKLSLKFTKKL